MTNIVNALVVEDYKLIADAWGKLLRDTNIFNTVKVLYSADNLTEYIEDLKPELIFMDINLPGSQNGIEITKTITESYPWIKIMILSIHNEPVMVRRAIENGAKGYITKNAPMKEMQLGVEKVMNGEKYLCEEIRHYCD